MLTLIRVATLPRCEHCQNSVSVKPRNLCSTCYYNPRIRGKYVMAKTDGRLGHDYDFYGPGSNCMPTKELPGSEEKIEVMAKRAAKKQKLFHPEDATRTEFSWKDAGRFVEMFCQESTDDWSD